MSHHRLTLVAAVIAFAALSVPATAQRVFVSTTGVDTNACTPAAPCRTFQKAHDVVATGGEIDVLDPGGYGSLTINKAVSIQGHGFSGISAVAGNTGIKIAAGPSDVIHLNGLLLDGVGSGSDGIAFNSGQLLNVENCVVRKFTASGLVQSDNGANSVSLTISNSYFADNGTNGILLVPNGTGAVTASIDRTVLSGNAFAGLNLIGQFATGALSATVTHSVAAHSKGGGAGFLTQSTTAKSVSILTVTNSVATGNAIGVGSNGVNSALVLGKSTVAINTTGYFAVNGGAVFSYGDNYINNNTNNNGSLTHATTQ